MFEEHVGAAALHKLNKQKALFMGASVPGLEKHNV